MHIKVEKVAMIIKITVSNSGSLLYFISFYFISFHFILFYFFPVTQYLEQWLWVQNGKIIKKVTINEIAVKNILGFHTTELSFA